MGLNATLIFAGVEAALPANSTAEVYLESVAGYLADYFNVVPPAHFHLQLYILSGLLGVQLLLMLASVGLRIKMGNYWFLRWNQTAVGSYLTPNFTVAWQYLVVIFIATLELACWYLVFWSEGHVLTGFYVMMILIWCGWWIAAILTVWALAVSRCEMLIHSRGPNEFQWFLRPVAVHILFPGVAIFGTLATVPWGVMTNTFYTRFYRPYVNIVLDCVGAAEESSALPQAQLTTVIDGLIGRTQAALHNFELFVWAFQSAYIACLAGTLMVYVQYSLIGVPCLLRLRRQLQQAEAPSPGGRSIALTSRRDLRLSYLTAVGTFALMSFFAAGYATLTAFVAFRPLTPESFSSKGYDTALGSLWITGGVGLFACFVALYRSVLQWREQGSAVGIGAQVPFDSAAIAAAIWTSDGRDHQHIVSRIDLEGARKGGEEVELRGKEDGAEGELRMRSEDHV